MVYYFDALDELKDSQVKILFDILPVQRQFKVKKYKCFNDRKLSIIAYVLLIYAIKNTLGYFPDLTMVYGERGKPYFKNISNWHFNISHCKDCVAVVLAKDEVGIDVQERIMLDDSLINMVCNYEERKLVESAQDPEMMITRLWVLKESYLKQRGLGLVDEISDIDFSMYRGSFFYKDPYYFHVVKKKDYFMSICTKNYINNYRRVLVDELMESIFYKNTQYA